MRMLLKTMQGSFFMHQLLIFRLKHTKGIGNIGRLKLLPYLMANPFDYCFETMLKIAEIKPKYHAIFVETFNESLKITEEDLALYMEEYGMITFLDKEYPEQLSYIYNPPVALFYKGKKELLQTPMLSIIGSREQTDFGKEMIELLMPDFINQKLTIVSGLAKGNDTSAHKLAIRRQGNTIGVLGFGLNRVYPKENQRLQEYMYQNQLVITEYLPNESPLPYHFPERNRIIAGLSLGTLVVEAKKRSGTFITAQLALEEGRSVFAIPNNPLIKESEGCLLLIKDGAKCVQSSSDILEEL